LVPVCSAGVAGSSTGSCLRTGSMVGELLSARAVEQVVVLGRQVSRCGIGSPKVARARVRRECVRVAPGLWWRR
jgi:hypothetical protein